MGPFPHNVQAWAPALQLDFNEQLQELTFAITAPRQSELECVSTKAEVLSKLLGVAVGACHKLDEHVEPFHFVAARVALQSLKESLKAEYMESIIPY